MSEINIGDYVVVMNSLLVPQELDCSTYDGLPCIVVEFKTNNRVLLSSPCKLYYGKPQICEAPLCQLIKISKEDGDEYIKNTMSQDTYTYRTRL